MSDELEEYPRPKATAVGSTEREYWLVFSEQIAPKLIESMGSYTIPEIAAAAGASRAEVARVLYEACRAQLPEIGVSGDEGEGYIKSIEKLREYRNLPRFTNETRFYHIRGSSAAE